MGVVGSTFSRDGIGGQFHNVAGGNVLLGQAGPEFKTVFRVDGEGRVFANGGFRPLGADFAESMPVAGDRNRYEPGDLMVSSSTPGHAMKGTDRQQMLGAVVGKALEPLREGKGVVHVLVTLQ